MRLVFLLVTLGGCHKLFDLEKVTNGGQSDGGAMMADANVVCPINPVVFDEDGDSIDDRCDACPTVASDSSDADGDGLPNACDPNLSTGDRILFYATFGSVNDMTAFTSTGTAVWSANNLGTVSLASSSTLRTILPYLPTMIDVKVAGVTAISLPATISIGNASMACTLQASDCNATRNDQVCLRFASNQAIQDGFIPSLTRMTLRRSGDTTSCDAVVGAKPTLTTNLPIANANIEVTASLDMQVVVSSIVVYGAK